MNLPAAIAMKACLFAAAGAATSIAVAWSLALSPTKYRDAEDVGLVYWLEPFAGREEEVRARVSAAGFGYDRLSLGWSAAPPTGLRMVVEGQATAPSLITLPIAPRPRECHLPAYIETSRVEHRFGWPLRSMWAAVDSSGRGCVVESRGCHGLLRVWPPNKAGWCDGRSGYGELDPFGELSEAPHVPTGHIYHGLAVNAAVYGAGWWALLALPARVRSVIRHRKGRCAICGYDLRGGGVTCPECGHRADHPATPRPASTPPAAS